MKEKLIAERFKDDYSSNISLEYDRKNPFEDLARDSGVDLNNQFLLGVTFTKIVMTQRIIFTVTNIEKY